jgi:hypothetical protein
MRPTDDLYQLIRSMSKSERGYFIKYSRIHVKGDQNNYMRLFDVISDMKEYSEEHLKRRLKNDAILSYLSTAKNQLHGIILKTMRPYYEEYSLTARLGDMINDAEFLHSKTLHQQSLKLNNRLKQQSLECEKPLYSLEALSREYNLLLHEIEDATERDELLEKCWAEQKKVMQILGNSLEMEYIKQKLQVFSDGKGAIRNEKDLAELNEIMSADCLQDLKKGLSADAETNRLLIRARAALLNSEYEAASRFLAKANTIFDLNPEVMRSHNMRYVEVLSKLIHAYLHSGRLKEAGALNGKLKRLPDLYPQFRTELLRSNIFIHAVLNELKLRQLTGEYNKALDMLAFIEQEMSYHLIRTDTNTKFLFHMRCSVICFLSGEVRRALQPLQEIMNMKYEKHNREYESFIRIYNLIIHYELDNKDHLFYAIKASLRYLAAKECLRPFEAAMISFVRNYINKGKRMQPQEIALRVLCDKLGELRDNRFESRAFEHFDFLSWAQRKLAKHLQEKEKSYRQNKIKSEFPVIITS